MGVYRSYVNKPKTCVECEYCESNGTTYTWCMEQGINVDGLFETPQSCPLIEIDEDKLLDEIRTELMLKHFGYDEESMKQNNIALILEIAIVFLLLTILFIK